MKITYDSKSNVLYLKLGEAEKINCKKVEEDITVDMDLKESWLV